MRYNIFDKERLVGQDYQRDNGEWSHKWFSSRYKSDDIVLRATELLTILDHIRRDVVWE